MRFEDLTLSQQAAVKEQGSILVSAAAGSGKTAVLAQRIIDALTRKENPISADRLLVVTFTVAAAGEMRSRIESGLEAYCIENPFDNAAARQKILLSSAKICTIDSFCAQLVRENFELANVDPDFKIAEESQLLALQNAAINCVLEKHFDENTEGFFELLDALGCVYDESKLSDQIKSIYEKAQNLPFCDKWLENAKKLCGADSFAVWSNKAFEYVQNSVCELLIVLNNVILKTREDGVVYKAYGPSLMNASDKLNKLIAVAEKEDWDSLYEMLATFSFDSFSSVKGSKDNPVAEFAKQSRDYIIKEIKELQKLFFDTKESVEHGYKVIAKHTELLLDLTNEYAKELNKQMASKQLLSFADIEQKALALICEYENSEYRLSDIAKEFIGAYDEVLVDEFQDVNDLQNILFEFLSDGGKHLFAVGDVKQSIYGFRGANPNNFLLRRKEAVAYDKAEGEKAKKIILGKNFRSEKDICDFANFFFSGFMTENNCSMEYEEDDFLIPNINSNSLAPNVRIDLIEADALLGEKVSEAKHIADYIEYVMSLDNGVYDKDTKSYRKAKYSDFAIILRKMKGDSTVIASELKARGIPVSYSKGDFLQSREIAVMISLLSVISNPLNDIDLLCVMTSELFGFSAEEVALIRVGDKKGSLYSAVLKQNKSGDKKTEKFLSELADMRRLAVLFSPSKLISIIYEKTDFINTVSLLSDGQLRRANLLQLVAEATAFEKNQNGSLEAFLRYLKSSDADKIKPAAVTGAGETVKIMSVHYSKGLQFPICILGFLSSRFNTQDITSSLIFDSQDGISFKYFDEKDGKVNSLVRQMLSLKARRNLLAEELRLFYVAATRAESSLVMMISSKNLSRTVLSAAAKAKITGGPFSKSVFLGAVSNSELIVSSLLCHPDATVLREISGEELEIRENCGRISLNICKVEETVALCEGEDSKAAETVVNALAQRFSYEYPYEEILALESKASVSEVAKNDSADNGQYDFSAVPAFMQENNLTPAQRGTATHKVMQFLDYNNAEINLEEELERLREWEFISEAEYDAVDKEAISKFVSSELFERIKNSQLLKREMRFITNVSAGYIHRDISESLKNEMIVLQGAVDCMFIEEEEIVVIDFKTDRVDNEAVLIERYSRQIDIYADVCKKIYGKKVKQKLIYSLWLNKEINID